jgi:hypothetical protein
MDRMPQQANNSLNLQATSNMIRALDEGNHEFSRTIPLLLCRRSNSSVRALSLTMTNRFTFYSRSG